MHFRFLPETVAAAPSPLSTIHAHRRIHGVIGILSCASTPDIAAAYTEFEQRCRRFPDATLRCLAFDLTTDAPGALAAVEDAKSRPDLIIFPPHNVDDQDHLRNHMEVVMHDFAACVLTELEHLMLSASPGTTSLTLLTDTPEFTGQAVAPYAAEDDAGRTKRKYARVQKAMGDFSLLAGSPLDALDHYNTATELGRSSFDLTTVAVAMEGYASAKLLHAAISTDAFAVNAESVFRDDRAWREKSETRRRSSSSGRGEAASPLSSSLPTTDYGDVMIEEDDEIRKSTTEKDEVVEEDEEEDSFNRQQFWAALRTNKELESEVRLLVEEAKSSIRKRGGLPLLVEADIMLARLLAGLHGMDARGEATELANAVQAAAEMLPLPEDRLIALTEAASILGGVGAVRKRVLLMWQAVELSKYFGFPDEHTLEVAREALEPPALPSSFASFGGGASRHRHNATLLPSSTTTATTSNSSHITPRRPLAQETSIPATWAPVRAGCLEATLGLAIYAKRHGDVWDAAAALLREHSRDLSTHRMQSLMDNLVAAASHLRPVEKLRPGKGPPPLLRAVQPRPPPPALLPVWLHFYDDDDGVGGVGGGWGDKDIDIQSPSSRGQGLFLYDPFSEKRKQEKMRQEELQRRRRHRRHRRRDASNTATGGGGGTDSNSKNNAVDGGSTEDESDSTDDDEDDEDEDDDAVEWIAGESAAVDIEVSNPTSVSIKIDKMVLEGIFTPSGTATSGTTDCTSRRPPPVPATKSIWKGKPVSLNIPAYTKPVRIQLEGTPQIPGTLRLTGCRLTAFGGVSWSQSFLANSSSSTTSSSSSTAKEDIIRLFAADRQSRRRRRRIAEGAAKRKNIGNSSSSSGSVVLRVLPPLPRLSLGVVLDAHESGMSVKEGGDEDDSMKKENTSTATATAIKALRVLKGQTLSAHLVLTNTGALPITCLRVGIESNAIAGGGGGGHPPHHHHRRSNSHAHPSSSSFMQSSSAAMSKVHVAVDTSALSSSSPSASVPNVASLLPLAPGASISVPISFHAPGGRAGASIEETATETIAVEYCSSFSSSTSTVATTSTKSPTYASAVSGTTHGTSSVTEEVVPGRRATTDVTITIQPSLVITHIEFEHVYTRAAAAAAAAAAAVDVGDDTKTAGEEYVAGVMMIAHVMNRGTEELLASLISSLSSTNTSTTASSSNGVVVGGGQRRPVAYLLSTKEIKEIVNDVATTTALEQKPSATSSSYPRRAQDKDSAPHNIARAEEEKQRQLCATQLAHRISLSYHQRSNAKGEGVLPLVHGEVYNGLTPSVLCMLRSCAVTIRLTPTPLPSSTSLQSLSVSVPPCIGIPLKYPSSLLGGSGSGGDDNDVMCYCPVVSVALGTPLSITLEIIRHINHRTGSGNTQEKEKETEEIEEQEVIVSLSSALLPHLSLSSSSSSSPTMPASSQHPSLSPREGNNDDGDNDGDDNVDKKHGSITMNQYHQYHAISANSFVSWVGRHSHLHFRLPPSGGIGSGSGGGTEEGEEGGGVVVHKHVVGVTMAVPGVYKIGTSHASVLYRGSGGGEEKRQTVLVRTMPCFIAVNAHPLEGL